MASPFQQECDYRQQIADECFECLDARGEPQLVRSRLPGSRRGAERTRHTKVLPSVAQRSAGALALLRIAGRAKAAFCRLRPLTTMVDQFRGQKRRLTPVWSQAP